MLATLMQEPLQQSVRSITMRSADLVLTANSPGAVNLGLMSGRYSRAARQLKYDLDREGRDQLLKEVFAVKPSRSDVDNVRKLEEIENNLAAIEYSFTDKQLRTLDKIAGHLKLGKAENLFEDDAMTMANFSDNPQTTSCIQEKARRRFAKGYRVSAVTPDGTGLYTIKKAEEIADFKAFICIRVEPEVTKGGRNKSARL